MTTSYSYIEFDDYCGEWLIPLLIVSEQGEAAPLFICRNHETSFDRKKWGKETTSEPWHAPLTKRLQLIATLCDDQYSVFQVIDADAYHLIWTRLNQAHSIAAFIFAADCQLSQLEKN